MKNPLVYVAIGLLKLYKLTLSPAFSALGIRCRHEPGCSSYSIEAFSRHGVWRGFWLTLSASADVIPGGHQVLIPCLNATITTLSGLRGDTGTGNGPSEPAKILLTTKTK